MAVYKWPIKTARHTGQHKPYWVAEFRDPIMDGMLGTGFNEGEAVKDLKQVRRECIHGYERDKDEDWWNWRPLTTNGRSK